QLIPCCSFLKLLLVRVLRLARTAMRLLSVLSSYLPAFPSCTRHNGGSRLHRESLPSFYYKSTNYAIHIIASPAFLLPSADGGCRPCCRSGRPGTGIPPRWAGDPARISG